VSLVIKLANLLTTRHKQGILVLLVLMVVGMLFETMSIGLIIPVFTILSKSEVEIANSYIGPFVKYLGNPPVEKLIVIVMVIMVLAYMVKNIYLGFLTWAQVKFANSVQVYLSQKLFSVYLYQPYIFHLQRNSAQLVRNVLGEVSQIQAAVTQLMTLFTELGIILGISVLLVATEPVGSISIFVFLGSVSWLSNKLTKYKIVQWGAERLHYDGQTNQHLMQGLSGVKAVKIYGREEAFLKIFYRYQTNRAKLNRRYSVIATIPKLWLELLAIIGLAALVIIMLAQGKPVSNILPTLSLFAVASFKLMPSMNKILNAIQGLNFTRASIEMVSSELSYTFDHREEILDTSKALKDSISIDKITFYYPGTVKPALENVSVKVKVNQSVGIVGSSGSGKSTLVDILLGILSPSAGRILVDNENIFVSVTKTREWQNQIGYVPQTIYLTDDTLRNNIAFGIEVKNIDDDAIDRALKAAQLDEFVDSLPEGLKTMVGERGVRLSGGQRQRIGIARALYHNPPVLVLDEATSALDQITEQGVMNSVKLLKGKTVIIVAHRYSTIEHCDWIIKLSHGKLVSQGPATEILHKQ